MTSPISLDELSAAFPFLRGTPSDLQEAVTTHGRQVRLEAGQFICMEGHHCQDLALVTEGVARVYKVGETGREITLYRIEPGESCILTATCILGKEAFPAYAVTETPVEAVLIPAYVFRQWVADYDPWRQYVFQLVSQRIGDVIAVVEEVTFRRMDARLAGYLLHAPDAREDAMLHRTHEAIAADLGSSREVISRLLKEFEHAGAVVLARGMVHVLDAGYLRDVAQKE